jgi:dinuclear metal center YbgI/SA1388 family protein
LRPTKTYVREILRYIEEIAPEAYALPGDPVGLQVGAPEMEVRKVAVALDADPKSVQIAVYRECELLIAHHPLIYHPLKSIKFGEPVSDAVRLLCSHQVAFIAVHTNWDCAPGGINDALAARLGLIETRPFGGGATVEQYKLVTFVPLEQLNPVLDAMAREGAGEIGLYRRCAFYHEGSGTYEPQPGAQPFAGEVGKRETASEYRLEVLVPQNRLEAVIEVLNRTHPYEEGVYDAYPLQTPKACPMGRVGRLPKPMNSLELRDYIAEKIENPYVRFYGKPQATIHTLAVLGGAGSDYWRSAKQAHADALLTGEVRHHHTWEASANDLVLFDGGHAETEMPGVIALADQLREFLALREVEVCVI